MGTRGNVSEDHRLYAHAWRTEAPSALVTRRGSLLKHAERELRLRHVPGKSGDSTRTVRLSFDKAMRAWTEDQLKIDIGPDSAPGSSMSG